LEPAFLEETQGATLAAPIAFERDSVRSASLGISRSARPTVTELDVPKREQRRCHYSVTASRLVEDWRQPAGLLCLFCYIRRCSGTSHLPSISAGRCCICEIVRAVPSPDPCSAAIRENSTCQWTAPHRRATSNLNPCGSCGSADSHITESMGLVKCASASFSRARRFVPASP
jgi:hypothetical protein